MLYCNSITGFNFQDYVCNGCHDLTMLSVNISDIAIITAKLLIIIVLFITLPNLKHLLCEKIQFLKIEGICKNYCLRFQSGFFTYFLVSIYKMVDSMDVYKYLNISYGTVVKNPEKLEHVPDPLKTKNMCKDTVKKLLYLLRYVSDQYKTQQICDEALLEYGGTLICILDCYKNQESVIKQYEYKEIKD